MDSVSFFILNKSCVNKCLPARLWSADRMSHPSRSLSAVLLGLQCRETQARGWEVGSLKDVALHPSWFVAGDWLSSLAGRGYRLWFGVMEITRMRLNFIWPRMSACMSVRAQKGWTADVNSFYLTTEKWSVEVGAEEKNWFSSCLSDSVWAEWLRRVGSINQGEDEMVHREMK